MTRGDDTRRGDRDRSDGNRNAARRAPRSAAEREQAAAQQRRRRRRRHPPRDAERDAQRDTQRRQATRDRVPREGPAMRRPAAGAEPRQSSRTRARPPARPVLDVRGLRTYFPVKAGAFSVRRAMVRAVDGVSLQLRSGETLGLVGESGCGKTTVGRSILRLYQPQAGRVFLEPDHDLLHRVLALDAEADAMRARRQAEPGTERRPAGALRRLSHKERRLRAEADRRAATSDVLAMPRARLKQARRRLQMVFQDPWASLNPRLLVRDLVAEGPREYRTHTGPALSAHVAELLRQVGLPATAAERFAHEFSGGQRQRIGIARALALAPSVVIADEPVSALDVSVQAQILNLLIALQEQLRLSYLFIAHDLAVVRYIAHRVAVMYLGQIVEQGSAEEITEEPRHPYTRSLMASVPVADPEVPFLDAGTVTSGEVPSPVNPPSGCPFHPRCPYRIDICSRSMPELQADRGGRLLACHNPPPATDRQNAHP